jgi:hypothetical protein
MRTNLWKLVNGRWVRRWDEPGVVETQERNGPPTKLMAGLLDRIEKFGPQIPTPEEMAEIDAHR